MALIQITNTYSGQVLDIVKSFVPEGCEIRLLKENSKEALLSCVEDADYIMASGRVPIDADVLNKASRLKMIQRTGVGLDSIDLYELEKRRIPFYVNQGVNADSVAEHTLMLILACLRKLPIVDHNTKNGIWIKQSQGIQSRELRQQIVGIYGMGNIGCRVAKLLKAFGTQILYHDIHRSLVEEEKLEIKYVSQEELFADADILTFHCPLTPETREVVCADSISRMKDGIILVNTARGALINENDLVEALKSGKVGFAGLDVFASEPVRNRRLLEQQNLIATSHIGGVTYDAFKKTMHDALRNIGLFNVGRLNEIEQYRYRL